MIKMTGAALLRSAACVALLSGCAQFETRPGHPLSYEASGYLDSTQKLVVEDKRVWNENATDDKQQPFLVGAKPVVEVQDAQSSALQIWEARGLAWNRHFAYDAAAHKAQDLADVVTVPLFGAAIAAAAAGLFHAGADAIAGAGLGGTSLAAAINYAHPEQDASTDLTAEIGLLCVLDATAGLRGNTADVPLLDDKAALSEALSLLAEDAAVLENTPNPSANVQAALKLIKDAQSNGQSALTNLDKAIATYDNLSAAIYEGSTRIDMAAQTNGRSLNYQTLVSSLQNAANSKAVNQNTKTQATSVQNDAAKVAASTAKQPKEQSADAILNLIHGAGKQQSGTLTLKLQSLDLAFAGKKSTGATNQAAPVLNQQDIGSLLKVTALTQQAADDISSQGFADITAQVASCGLSPSAGPKSTATGNGAGS